MSITTKRPIYRLRLQSLPDRDDDDIRYLRALLKSLLRQHHFRALSVEIEREADAERASAGNKPVPPGLSPLQAFQHALWGWHDQRRHDDPKHHNQQTYDSSQDDAAAITRDSQQAATAAKDKTMVTKSDVFPSRYFKAADLDGPIVLTVSEAPLEELKNQGRAEKKVVLHFKQTSQVFPLNKVNWESMERITHRMDSNDWAGCKIEPYPTQTEMRGETVDCIRIRKPGAEQTEPPESPVSTDMRDEIPF